MNDSQPSQLFSPIQIGTTTLGHRVVMAPLTRSRSVQPGDLPGDLMVEYYGQRASQGGLIITEATTVAITGRGWYGAPGLYADTQIEPWNRVVDKVHGKGGTIFAQLWHVGRASNVAMTGGMPPVSASVNPAFWTNAAPSVSAPRGWLPPSPHRALSIAEIAEIIDCYRDAAARAKSAGFDGVELHGANGYLIDQFLQDGSNHRTDSYGGSIENRTRLLLEVVEAMASVWGGDRVAVRIAPGGTFNGMGDSNPSALFAHVAEALNQYELAYLHVVEPRIKGSTLIEDGMRPTAAAELRKIFRGKIMAAGGFEPDTAEAIIESGDADLVAFGRHFLSNPDLPARIKHGWPLNPYDRSTFYTFDAKGYTDYPLYSEAALSR